jgi:hypothetical protein
MGETAGCFRTARCHSPEGHTLPSHRRGNLKPQRISFHFLCNISLISWIPWWFENRTWSFVRNFTFCLHCVGSFAYFNLCIPPDITWNECVERRHGHWCHRISVGLILKWQSRLWLTFLPRAYIKNLAANLMCIRIGLIQPYIFFLNSGLWGYWHCGHSWPIVSDSGNSEDDCGEADGM